MSPHLSKTEVVSRDVLERLVDVRLGEAAALRKAGFLAAAIYIGGYALECKLKGAICTLLDLTMLPATFKTHDLELLLLHGGLHNKLKANEEVDERFKKICGMWNGKMDLRYEDPSVIGDKDVRLFFEWVEHPDRGVIPWLRTMS